MFEEIYLNVPLLRRRVPHLTAAAQSVGLRPATVSNLCTGKVPLGKAEVKTIVALAALAGCSLDELIIVGHRAEFIETGIKVVDLFAPLVRGGTIGFVARPGVGQLVLLAELVRRMGRRGMATMFWKPVETTPGIPDVESESMATGSTPDEMVRHLSLVPDEQDILIAADRSAVLSGELQYLRERLEGKVEQPVTVVLVDIQGNVVDEDLPYGPLDSLVKFDVDLAARGLYPAVDPISSTSILLEGNQLDNRHLSIQQQARKTLRRYRELRSIVQLHGTQKLSPADAKIYTRGEALEELLQQPFYVAEPFTQKPGEWIPVGETLNAVGTLLSPGWNPSDREA